jgi:hypothetical protein
MEMEINAAPRSLANKTAMGSSNEALSSMGTISDGTTTRTIPAIPSNTAVVLISVLMLSVM